MKSLEPISVKMPEGLEELVPGYLSNRKDEIPMLLQLLAASDFDRIRIVAHNMKGTGSAYGLEKLTEIGAGMESSAREANICTLSEQLNSLAEYLERVELDPAG